VKRALVLAAAVPALAASVAACGDGPAPPRAEPEVRLVLGSPADGTTVQSDTVPISGTVRPAGAHVEVLGKQVAVSGGSFSADVPLEPGVNLVDVSAGIVGRRPAFAVTRVVREVRVPVPDVVGGDADTAQSQLEGLGLSVTKQDSGGFFDPLLPGDPKVCEVRPRAGTDVLPGSEVTLLVARDC
jgi:Glucodextranase, domain B/PASTA domain